MPCRRIASHHIASSLCPALSRSLPCLALPCLVAAGPWEGWGGRGSPIPVVGFVGMLFYNSFRCVVWLTRHIARSTVRTSEAVVGPVTRHLPPATRHPPSHCHCWSWRWRRSPQCVLLCRAANCAAFVCCLLGRSSLGPSAPNTQVIHPATPPAPLPLPPSLPGFVCFGNCSQVVSLLMLIAWLATVHRSPVAGRRSHFVSFEDWNILSLLFGLISDSKSVAVRKSSKDIVAIFPSHPSPLLTWNRLVAICNRWDTINVLIAGIGRQRGTSDSRENAIKTSWNRKRKTLIRVWHGAESEFEGCTSKKSETRPAREAPLRLFCHCHCPALPQPRVTCPPILVSPLHSFFDFGLSISFCQFKETLAISGQAASLFLTSFCFEQCQRRQRWWHIFSIHFQSIRCPKKTWPG